MSRKKIWRGRRWGGPAFPRVERPGNDAQWEAWVAEKRDGWTMPFKWVGSGKDKPNPEERIQDALDDPDGFGGPFTKDQQKEKVERKYQERTVNREKGE